MGATKNAKKGPRRDRGREQFWRGMVQRHRTSGKSVRAFCEEQGLSEPSFYGWRSELARRDLQAARTKIAGRRASSALLPVQIVGAASLAASGETSLAAACIEIVLRDNLRLRIGPAFQAEALARLLDVLEARPC